MVRPGDSSKEPVRQPDRRPEISDLLKDFREVQRVLQRAVRQALDLHKKLGFPIAAWEGGKVVWIPAEQIRVDG